MKTLCITNQKGGVAKTTIALLLGQGLIRRGLRVVWIDTDPQGNLTYLAGASDENERNVLTAMLAPNTAMDAVSTAQWGDIIPATEELATQDWTRVSKRNQRLKEVVALLAPHYDYCILDTPPSLGTLTVAALTAADAVIIPALPDVLSLRGIRQLADTVVAVKEATNPSLTVAGIVITRYTKRRTDQRDLAKVLAQAAERLDTKVYTTRIRECVAVVKAQMCRTSIWDYAPQSIAVNDFDAWICEVTEND